MTGLIRTVIRQGSALHALWFGTEVLWSWLLGVSKDMFSPSERRKFGSTVPVMSLSRLKDMLRYTYTQLEPQTLPWRGMESQKGWDRSSISRPSHLFHPSGIQAYTATVVSNSMGWCPTGISWYQLVGLRKAAWSQSCSNQRHARHPIGGFKGLNSGAIWIQRTIQHQITIDKSWSCLNKHTHTHTHIYIYIYI